MKKTIKLVLSILFIGGIFILSDALFTVHQTEQVLVLQFGDPKQVITTPGLKIKLPFIQNVVHYDNRLLDLDPPAEQVILADQKRLEVDSFTRYRIADPLKFYQSVLVESQARTRLSDIVNSSVRGVLGRVTLPTLLSIERTDIMADIQKRVDSQARELGVEIGDVRIRRADLPTETSQSIYARMRSEREREAREFRAQGQEYAQQIRSRAEREQTVILAEADKTAQELRGTGDQEATDIWAKAASKDPEFYAFYRSLEAYRKSIQAEGTSLVLSPDSAFFEYFQALPKGTR